MSVVVKTNRGKHKPVSTTALWLVLGLAVTFFLVRFGQELLLEHDLKAKAAAQRNANARMRDENTRLEAALEYYRSDKYIEQRAREDLNLRRPDEEVLIPVSVAQANPAGDSAIPATPQEAPPSTTQAELANWQKWLELFSPPPGAP
ncbi:MAG TPA: septum formation initiator family protein [Chloroflexia bacterium]|nr:septum formation initiator family protein [Chloroflexia bacterium]